MQALVTGGNGHLGYNLVLALRAAGHHVRASVRSLSDEAKTAPLRALGDVEIVEAELHQPERLRSAMEGVEVLFHAAAVYGYVDRSRDREVIDSSVIGAENALRAAADAKVRRIVFTSSEVTLPLTARGAPPVTETDWTADLRIPYFRAKVEGERAAWRLAKELGLDMVSLLPGGITGPGFRRNTPTIDILEAVLGNAFRMGVPEGNFPMVDVRDVTRAHLMAAEKAVGGRFILVDAHPSYREIIAAVARIEPRVKPPLMAMPAFMTPLMPFFDWLNHATLGTPRTVTPEVAASVISGKVWNASPERAKRELGWVPEVPFEQSLRDTITTIRANRAPSTA